MISAAQDIHYKTPILHRMTCFDKIGPNLVSFVMHISPCSYRHLLYPQVIIHCTPLEQLS